MGWYHRLLTRVYLSALLFGAAVQAIQVGDAIPNDIELHYGFPPTKINVKDYVAGKKVILVGLPGAFTPTCSTRQVPGYLANVDALKTKFGIDHVIVYCVNDGAVMEAWAENLGVPSSSDSIIQLMGDPYSQVTEAFEMELTHVGPKLKGLVNRCKRFALYLEDGIVKIVRVAESEEDPAGDDFPDVTLAEAMMEAIETLDKMKNVSDEL